MNAIKQESEVKDVVTVGQIQLLIHCMLMTTVPELQENIWQIITFKRLTPANVWHFNLINDLKVQLITKITCQSTDYLNLFSTY